MTSERFSGGEPLVSHLKSFIRPRAVRGSPDPAPASDRRSPDSFGDDERAGDLRSRPAAGSGDPRRSLGFVSTAIVGRIISASSNGWYSPKSTSESMAAF